MNSWQIQSPLPEITAQVSAAVMYGRVSVHLAYESQNCSINDGDGTAIDGDGTATDSTGIDSDFPHRATSHARSVVRLRTPSDDRSSTIATAPT